MNTYGTLSFTYTANGEQQSKTDSASGQQTQYSYDGLGNLTQATLPTGEVLQYSVDGLNHRSSRANSQGPAGNPDYVHYLTDVSGRVYAVTDENIEGYSASEFAYATGKSAPDAMERFSFNPGLHASYKFILDERGSVRQVIDSSGNIVQAMDYDEFGNVTRDTNPGFQPFGFAGCLYDPDTKLCHFGARDFDSLTGRWMQKDPLLFGGGDTNLYGYVF